MKKEEMVGKKLVGVQIAKDRQAIKFDLEGGESVIANCDADCCSYTWIEHVELPSLPGVITAIEDINMPDMIPAGGKYGGYGENHETDYVQFYGLKVTLSTGDLIVDYRNDSNGYYGGNLSWPGDYYYGGVFGQNESKQDWVDAKEE